MVIIKIIGQRMNDIGSWFNLTSHTHTTVQLHICREDGWLVSDKLHNMEVNVRVHA